MDVEERVSIMGLGWGAWVFMGGWMMPGARELITIGAVRFEEGVTFNEWVRGYTLPAEDCVRDRM
jgi:hypothetical protein